MSNQKERAYVGKGKQVGEYDLVNISLRKSQLDPHFYEYNGDQYIRLTVGKRKEVDQYGNSHTVWVNDYKADNSQAETKKAPIKGGDGLPF